MISILREELPTIFGERASGNTVRAGLRRAERVAWWMEESIELPLLHKRFGLDTILGVVPGLGDLVGALLSLYPIVEGLHLGAPRRLIGRMLANVVADFALGLLPVVGHLLDAWYKANVRNLALLQRHFRAA